MPSAESPENSGESQENMGEFVDIPRDKLLKLKVSELKSKLAKHGQNTTGLKAVLQQWLKEALEQCLPLLSQSDQALVPLMTLLASPQLPVGNHSFLPKKL